jgi:hypothetical protein
MKRRLLSVVLILAWPVPSFAWWVKGHETIVKAAAGSLPADMPVFFRAGTTALAQGAGDPDRWKNRAARFLRPAESPDHYIDLEDYQGKPLPEDRYQAIQLLYRLGARPERAGMLPYAVMEHFDRLTVAFYDYRQNPDDEAVRSKWLVFAGLLSHYTGDTVVPLHTTRDYDGRKQPDGSFLQKGIHARIDGFPEKFNLTAEEIARGLTAREEADPWKRVAAEIDASHKLVDRCYEFDRLGAFRAPTEVSRAFILDRCRSGAQFTADLFYTAWKRSATLQPPY